MFVAGHAAAGALIAHQLPQHPILVLTLAFVSHFLLDIVPHGDAHHVHDYYHGGKKHLKQLYYTFVADALGTIVLVSLLFAYVQMNRVALAWGIIGGILPDLLVAADELMTSTRLRWFTKLHFRFHNALTDKFHVKALPGAAGQILVIAGLLFAL